MKRAREHNDAGDPSAKRRASGQILDPNTPTNPPSHAPFQDLQTPQSPSPAVDPDSGIDLSFGQGQATDQLQLKEPPDSGEGQDWGPVYDELAKRRRKENKQMDQEARQRRLRQVITDPAGIRPLIVINQTIQKAHRYPPLKLNLTTEDIMNLEAQFGNQVLAKLDSL